MVPPTPLSIPLKQVAEHWFRWWSPCCTWVERRHVKAMEKGWRASYKECRRGTQQWSSWSGSQHGPSSWFVGNDLIWKWCQQCRGTESMYISWTLGSLDQKNPYIDMKLGTRLFYVITHRSAIFDGFHGGDFNLQCLNVLEFLLQSFDGSLQARNGPGQGFSGQGSWKQYRSNYMSTRNRN